MEWVISHHAASSQLLDLFYTQPALARQYVERFLQDYPSKAMVFVEPAAGAGAFVKPLRDRCLNVVALDLKPAAEHIVEADFLQDALWHRHNPITVIGNPPFGFASSMAIKFFNRAAKYAERIAFIVPRTFRKVSVQNKLARHFWLCHDEDVPKKAFIKEGAPHDVPCSWQIWEKRFVKRPLIDMPDVSHIIRYTAPAQADFALRRVGGKAGKILPLQPLTRYSLTSTYFIHSVHPAAEKWLSTINWSTIKNATAGVRSISKQEIAIELEKVAKLVTG